MKGITLKLFACCVFVSAVCYGQDNGNRFAIDIKIDGSKRLQRIDGIGINVNTRSWNGEELKPALDLLLDSMHATVWRVIVETVEKWEEVNDNDDPFSFNWDYYNKLYETPKFQKVWDMMRYLNQRGITDRLMINFMGFAPSWMGIKVIKPEYEDEYVEMIVSFFYYAIKTKHLKFGFIAPSNESDHPLTEGPHLNAKQHARIIRKLIERMESLGVMDGIGIVAPDNASTDKAVDEFIPAMEADTVVMSKLAHLGFHSYGGYHPRINPFILKSPYPHASYWVTEWNAWCNGCDDGILGEYNYAFAAKSVGFLLELLKNGANACLGWEGYDSYYEHHAPSPFSYWGFLAYDSIAKKYIPRENFYAVQQVSRYVAPGSYQVALSSTGDSLPVLAFYDSSLKRLTITGINSKNKPVALKGLFSNLPVVKQFEIIYTDSSQHLRSGGIIKSSGGAFTTLLPPDCIFTLVGYEEGAVLSQHHINPEPRNWYTGDIHVHKNCGGEKVLEDGDLVPMMDKNNLAVISVLADMGNGEVKHADQDLKKVNGNDAPQSKPGRIFHWDTEWHWDATYSQFSDQALGGHLVLLGLKNAKQIWAESPYKILEWAHEQKAVTGFAHLEYLNDSVQNELNCCIPVDYPVEAALKTIDFVSEDVFGNASPNGGAYNSEAVVNAYYKLLNCGFRPGLAAGTDYPCNDNEPLGTLLTYVKVKGRLTYGKWIKGIKDGHTVVSRNGHDEFIDLNVNGKYGPGDELSFKSAGTVTIAVTWTSASESAGRIELVSDGKVIASQPGNAKPGEPVLLTATKEFTKSSWICARRMDERGHETHTAPVFITVDKKPVRASAEDAQFFINWIDNILRNIAPGGKWSRYFTKDSVTVQQRYQKARDIYSKILAETKNDK